MSQNKQIGEVAHELEISPKTIRYYEEMGLISPSRHPESGYRLYAQADIDRLAFILRSRELDFSLSHISQILALRDAGEAPCQYVTARITQQLATIEARIAVLTNLHHELTAIQQQANAIPQLSIATNGSVCHLIEN